MKNYMGVWQRVAMESLKYHQGLPCPTHLCLEGRQPLKRHYSHFRVVLPRARSVSGRLLHLWTPHAVRL
jgi:hypothetical protein